MIRSTLKGFGQAGDTLVEVTIAFAIISLTMASSFGAATQAYNIGQLAKERTQVSNIAQEQIEALKSFRDSRSWPKFLDPGTADYQGITEVLVNCDDTAQASCFHMSLSESKGVKQWLPAAGPLLGNDAAAKNVAAGNYFVAFTIQDPAPLGMNADLITFKVRYGLTSRGSSAAYDNRNDVYVRLANLDTPTLAAADGADTPTPPPVTPPPTTPPTTPPPATPTPTPTPDPDGDGEAVIDVGYCSQKDANPDLCGGAPGGGTYHYQYSATNGSRNLAINVRGCELNWGDGTSTGFISAPDPRCYFGGTFNSHVYSEDFVYGGRTIQPYPLECGGGGRTPAKIVTQTLTVFLWIGGTRTDKKEKNLPHCY